MRTFHGKIQNFAMTSGIRKNLPSPSRNNWKFTKWDYYFSQPLLRPVWFTTFRPKIRYIKFIIYGQQNTHPPHHCPSPPIPSIFYGRALANLNSDNRNKRVFFFLPPCFLIEIWQIFSGSTWNLWSVLALLTPNHVSIQQPDYELEVVLWEFQ